MNKEKFKAKLHNCEERLKDVAKAIEETRKQLCAEAEKPKLRHGDFGISKSDLPWLAVRTMTDGVKVVKVEVFWYNSADPSHLDNNDFISSRLGNIFDLMKDWGEDLILIDMFAGCRKFKAINICDKKGIWIEVGDTAKYSLDEAEEIWRKLGQMIMTLKRKENK